MQDIIVKMEVNMNTMVIISEEENERMIDIIEELNALKVLAQTLAANNELYHENSEMYGRIKKELKSNTASYRAEWHKIIEKYRLDPEKGDNYVLNFNDRSIHYIENS